MVTILRSVAATYTVSAASMGSPATDINLGIHLYVDGTACDAIHFYTSKPGTHSINYDVTDAVALTAMLL
jgi:hypothetical protein